MLDIMTLQQAMAEMRAAGGFHMSRQTMILAIKQHPDMFPFVEVIETQKQRRYIIFRPKFEEWMRKHGAYRESCPTDTKVIPFEQISNRGEEINIEA